MYGPMFFQLVLWVLSYPQTVVTSPPPPSSETPISSPNLLVPAILAPPPRLSGGNLSSSSSSSPIGSRLRVTCDSRMYGRNLKVPSCRSIFHYLHRDDKQVTFAERDSGVPHNIPLPVRTFSNDGVCFVQPFLKQGAISGHASPTEVGQAAYTLLQTCVVERGMGGVAFNIGGDNNLDVAISDFKPNVKCDLSSTPEPPWESCVAIIVNMRAAKRVRVFGFGGDPGVEEELPLILEAGDNKCQAFIDIEGDPTMASWYEVWEGITAIAMMCTRSKHKGGRVKGIGLAKTIYIELSAKESTALVQPGGKANSSTVLLPPPPAVAVASSIPLRDFDLAGPSSSSSQAAFDRGLPFDLIPAGNYGDDGNLDDVDDH